MSHWSTVARVYTKLYPRCYDPFNNVGDPVTLYSSINCMENTMLYTGLYFTWETRYETNFAVSMATMDRLWRHIRTPRCRFTYFGSHFDDDQTTFKVCL